MKFFFCVLLLLLNNLTYSFQNKVFEFKIINPDAVIRKNNENVLVYVKKAICPIKIDGLICETDWEKAEKANDFRLVLPVGTGMGTSKSEVVINFSCLDLKSNEKS